MNSREPVPLVMYQVASRVSSLLRKKEQQLRQNDMIPLCRTGKYKSPTEGDFSCPEKEGERTQRGLHLLTPISYHEQYDEAA
jgi:hypothetical protein